MAEEVHVQFESNAPICFNLAQNNTGGSCHITSTDHSKLKIYDKLFCLNSQPIPRGLNTAEVMGILKIAQRPFTLTVLREGGADKGKSIKSLWGGQKNKKQPTAASGKSLEEELNVVLGKDEWAPLGMTFQTCTDGSHKIIFVDPEGQGGYAGVNVGDLIVGVNYKPISFGYTHDEVVKLIRGTPKPFTLNVIRKKPDEVSGLVGQVKTSLAALETIASKDEEIISLREELKNRQSDTSKDEEIARLKSQVASLQSQLNSAKLNESQKIEAQFEAVQTLVKAQQQHLQFPLSDATNSKLQLSAVRTLVESGNIKKDLYQSLCKIHGVPADIN